MCMVLLEIMLISKRQNKKTKMIQAKCEYIDLKFFYNLFLSLFIIYR